MKDVARFLKVLADQTRLEILWLLHSRGELCVCDIMEALGVTQSKASRHLATLRHAGLVTDRKAGAWSYYSLCRPKDDLGRAVLKTLRAGLAGHPGAARILADLNDWMARKERGVVCAAVGQAAAKGKTARRKRKGGVA